MCCMIAAASCTKTPEPAVALSLKATIDPSISRFDSFVDTDAIGVFVSAKKNDQANLKYAPATVGKYEDYGTQYMLSEKAASSELTAQGDAASFTKGEHKIYAYLPYVEGAELTAVPVKDLSEQDITGTSYGKQYMQTDWVFEYASQTINAAGEVNIDFTTPMTMINNGAVRDDYFTLPAEAETPALKSVTITADGPIAYKNPSFDLTSGKFNGEPANSISLKAKKSKTSISAKFLVACDKESALKLTYTVKVELENGDVYTASSKAVESTIPDAVDFMADVPSVKLESLTFTKK